MKQSKPKQGITFLVWSDEEEKIRGFQLTGHAGYAEYGQDIVCAAISALGFSAVNGLECFLSVPPQIEAVEETGSLNCTLPDLSGQELDQAQWILKTMLLGIEGIQQEYGQEYITISRRRWTPC